MKALKLLIFLALFGLGNSLSAQVVVVPNHGVFVNNNTPLANGTVEVHYTNGCGPISVPLVANTSTAQVPVPCDPTFIDYVSITFSDLSCSPAQIHTVTLNPLIGVNNFTYVDCSGVIEYSPSRSTLHFLIQVLLSI